MNVHLIGIGGIGVSALAQYYLSKGYKVSGSDLVASEIIDFLKKKGIEININPKSQIPNPNQARNPNDQINILPDMVVYSPAVKQDNLELKFYNQKSIKCLSYPEALGELTKEYYTIAVAGAHGKSTTTSMIALVMAEAGLDPTVIVGTKIKEFGNSNFRAGKSKFLVIEACEYDSSFLRYKPKIIVVTNVDKEHLDYFKTFANVKKAFKSFILKLPDDGFFVFNKDDEKNSKFKIQNSKIKFKIQNYSLRQLEAKKFKKILKVPGEHNISNALATLQVARILGIPDKIIFNALSKFKGTWRRFEIKQGTAGSKKITVISDYGHHPNEISATLNAAREKYINKKIWCIFQPHQYQRTFYLFNDFVKTFRKMPIDKIIITDIYDVAGREIKTINREVSSEKLVEKINKKNISYIQLCDIEKFVKKNIKSGDILIIMGAGDIYKFVDKF